MLLVDHGHDGELDRVMEIADGLAWERSGFGDGDNYLITINNTTIKITCSFSFCSSHITFFFQTSY